MGWLNSTSNPEEDQTSDTQSDRSASPDIPSNNSQQQLLSSKISTMEATHIDQLHEVTTQMAERELQYKEDSKNNHVQLQQSLKRADALERRIRERDAQMSSLKEEKAGCNRQISDLKNQMYQLQFEVEEATSDKAEQANEWQSKLSHSQREVLDAKRALDEALQSQNKAVFKASVLDQENNALRKQHSAHQGNQENELAALQQQLSELQSANASLTAQITEERASATKSKELNSKETSNFRSMLRARDEAIQSLQGRVETGQDDMTALEAELDELRGDKQTLNVSMEKERIDQITRLMVDNEEMNVLVEKQNQALKEMTARFDRQKGDYEEQYSLAENRREEIELLKSALHNGELEKEASLERSNSTHSRASALEMELQTMHEKVDELTSSLNEALEEIEDLQADVIVKEGRISVLEKEIEEASSLLEARAVDDNDSQQQSSGQKNSSGNFARLRQEIEKVTRERAQLESDHAKQLVLLKTSKDGDIANLEKDLESVRSELEAAKEGISSMKASLEEMEASNADLEHELEKTREVMDQLDAEEDRELEEMKQQVGQLELVNDKKGFEIEELRMMLNEKEQELAKKDADVAVELREAQQALIALDKERREPSRERDDGKDEKIKTLNEQLFECKEQVRATETKLTGTIRVKDMAISDLKVELSSKEKYAEDLKDELEALELSVEKGPSKRNYGMAIDPEWHEPDTISRLKVQVSRLRKEKQMVENELRAKIDSRDSTIATLVLSSGRQETSIFELKSEVNRLQTLVDTTSSSADDASHQLKDLESSRRKEVETLKDRAQDLTIELKQTKRKLLSATEELECAKSQLEAADTMVDTQDLAGRLVVSEQAQRMLKNENSDKLKERDAAIANLLQSMQANEGVISNLRADIDSFKKKLNDSIQENRRLQHESEIFAQQIIDQDEEFESLNARLREKTGEVSSLKQEIASSSADLRHMKNLETQLDELRQDKRQNTSRINNLECELRDVELKKAKEEGFEVERLKLELKNAIADKEHTESKLTEQIDSLRKLRNHAVDDFEAKLRMRDGQIASLEKELLELRESQDDFDDIFLEDKPGQQSKKELVEERDMLMTKIEALGEEIELLRTASAKDSSHELSDLKSRLAHSEQVREELEKDRNQFNSSKDREMDRLHRQLAEAKEAQTARELEQLSLLKKLESENSDIREEFTLRIREKNVALVALEQTLAAQEQVVANMSNEMDQLQSGMEKISVQRRAEIEEMQQELMDYTSKATKLEREVMALSMKLSDKKLKHKAELAKMKDKIASMESETPLEKIVRHDRHDDRQHERELGEKNDHLKWLNSSLKDENEKLKGKMEVMKIKQSKKKEEGPSAKNNDRWRNVALQEQVAVLSQRVIELEETAAAATTQSMRSTQSLRPSILHSPVMRSSLERGAVPVTPNASTSSPTPKSALRVSSYDDAAANNQANNELLANFDDERGQRESGLNSRIAAGTPPILPRPSPSSIGTPGSVSQRSKGSKMSSSRFSIRKRSSSRNKDRLPPSPKFDDASNSTTNYDF